MRGAASILLLLCAGILQAQQDEYRSKITVQGGLVRSLGDITSGLENFDPQRTAMLGLSYECFLSYGVSLFGGLEHLRLSGNDRRTGNLDRSLNFLAKVNTAQIGLRFYADNGRLLNYDARFAPFIQLGIGVGTYDVYGDLYSGTGARYNYWSDGTIRTLPETALDAETAQLMEQDGVFETRLTDLATEEGKPRDAWFLSVPARLGMKWRISDRFSAELAYAFNWTFTDHLDDVSGDYPRSFANEELAYISNPAGHAGPRGNNGSNDHYHHLSLGLSVGIGRRSHKFRMPPVRAVAPPVMIPIAAADTLAAPPRAEEMPTDTVTRRVIIEVESIRVGRLEVDTLIMRGGQAADTMVRKVVPQEPMLKDPAVKDMDLQPLPDSVLLRTMSDTLKQLEVSTDTLVGPSSVAADPEAAELELRSLPDTMLVRTTPDTLKQLEVSTDTIVGPGSVAADPEADDMELHSLPDTMLVRTTPDTLKQLEVSTDTIAPPPSDVEDGRELHPPADTTQLKTTPDTLIQKVAPLDTTGVPRTGATDPVPRKVIIDTVATPRQQLGEQSGSAAGDTKSAEPGPVRTVEQRTTERIIERVAPPVVVIQKELVRDTVVKEVPVMVPDTASLKADTATGTPRDSVMKATQSPPVRSDPAPLVRSALEIQRDHAVQMNRVLNDRIQTLERYLAIQEEHGGAAEIDSLRQRIAELDDEMKVLRGSAVPPVLDDAPERGMAIMDSVRFASESFVVSQAFKENLEATARQIIEQNAPKVLVTGHTDRSGDADYNLALSQRRAEAVADVLSAAGVPSDRIKVKGLGQQLASERYDRNERVVIVQVAME